MTTAILSPPDPHPLDFDWRFSEECVADLVQLLHGRERVLAVGAPSIARFLQSQGRDVVLIDRQPLQGVKNHLRVEVGADIKTKIAAEFALLDPPWYPEDTLRWVTWTANTIGKGGTIILSVWPDHTRPNASVQKQFLAKQFAEWANVEILETRTSYEIPSFELTSSRVSTNELATSPRSGDLWRITVGSLPQVPQGEPTRRWFRFTINNYQLAIADDSGHAAEELTGVTGADGWLWPYVSRRARNRDQIDVWSSANEVASTNSSRQLVETLRKAIRAVSVKDFSEAMTSFPELMTWKIPRPPYWRIHEWRQ